MALPGTVSVASESKAAEPVGKPFEPGIISLRQRPIPNSQTSRTTKSLIPSIPMSQRNFWQNWFFRASVFAIRIPLVSADEGDDFSNNLATDLAPILSLFGEQVTKQYMSQSMTWLENVIFGMAPLGILTAMVGAIRVGGYKWMKAAVGRAQEGKGIVEMELMSSTSADVCEMWDGDRVIRVLGTPSVAQLFYLVPDNTQIAVGAQSTDSNSAREYLLPPLRDNMLKIYDLKTVPKPWLSRTRPQETNRVESNPGPQETNCAESNPGPNLALNLGGHIVSISELYAVAIIGTVLQLGVILFPGLTRLYLKDTLMKDGKQPQKYALPCMATGTVALVIGMILCSHLVQRSTDEQTWEFKKINGYRVEVVWLQKGRVVNDQQFGSYFIPLVRQQPKKSGILSCLFKQRRKNSQHPLRTSHRATEENIQNQAELTLLAIILGLIGFILQFIGLRGLNWTVTIAQLGSAIIMTILRAIIRRNMAYHITSESIETNHELDEAARRIRGCDCWNIVTVANSRVRDPRESTGDDQSQPTASRNGSDQHTSLAHRVFNTRCQLEEHCLWEFQWQRTVDFMAAAIEGTMNFIYMNPDIYKKGNLGKKFQWKLSVQVDNRSPPCLEDVELNLFREDLSNYRGLGPWKAEKSEIRAALGLWMLHFRLESKKHLLKQRH
ncbi:hypothetical protein EV426DRAFT_43350 [Tirmania nivea]|nr:hypothetical protein EV426DRAFT_43350 [Tirmania nivea]